MNDRENGLLDDFFREAAQLQIADDGFSERVMGSLPTRRTAPETVRRLSRLWTLFCVVVGGSLLLAFGGWEALKDGIGSLCGTLLSGLASYLVTILTGLEVLTATIPTIDVTLSPATILLILAFVLVYLPYQTIRRLSAIR